MLIIEFIYISKWLCEGAQYFTDVQTDAGLSKGLTHVFQWSGTKVKARIQVSVFWLSFVRITVLQKMKEHEHNRFFPGNFLL